LQSIITNFKWR